MKKVNIAYWIVTVLFAAFMIFTAIPDITLPPDVVKIMHEELGYPMYIIPFIGVAKIIGSLIILIPGFPRIKEWAYAGLFIDLAGATYSNLSLKFDAFVIVFMLICFGFFFASYFLYHKRMKMKGLATV